MSSREGTDVDAGYARKVFERLGYNVKVANDQTVQQIRQLLYTGKFTSLDVSVLDFSSVPEAFEKFF